MKTIIALLPETRQIGYAVFEGKNLVEWGSKPIDSVGLHKRVYLVALPFFRSLVNRYEPEVVVLPERMDNLTTVRSRFIRAVRYELIRKPRTLFAFSRHVLHNAFKPFLKSQRANKYTIMQLLVQWFPELRRAFPPPRRLWQSQRYWVSMFDAIGLVITYLSRNE
jgi:hypothetical protein